MTQIALHLPDSDARFVQSYAASYGLSIEELFIKYVQALQLSRKYPVSDAVKEFTGLIPKEARPEEEWSEHNVTRR